jgi:hypothetical protein
MRNPLLSFAMRKYRKFLWRRVVTSPGVETRQQITPYVVMIPYNPNFSTPTPEGERGEISWLAWLPKGQGVKQDSLLFDSGSVGQGKQYQIVSLKEWADYLEAGLK